MANKPIPPQRYLMELLDYNPDSGIFRWKPRSATTIRIADWNIRWGWKIAGWRNSGRISMRIENVRYYAHRLAWVYVYGSEPPNEIDHINGDGFDNRGIR